MRTRHTTTAAIAAAALLTLTACSSDTTDNKPTTTASSSAETSPSTTPSPTQQQLTLGQPWTWEAPPEVTPATGNTTALSYTQPVTGIEPPGESLGMTQGAVWGQLEAKVCTTEGMVIASQFPWSLAFPDGARVQVTGLHGGDFPKPEFPMDAAVWASDCVRGNIMFPIPEGQRPERILYTPSGAETPVEWTVPQQ